jgi:capsule polysaccharide export protein KpsE/RkpR
MEEKKINSSDIIDLRVIFKKIWDKKELFLYKVWPITFVLACIYILGVPRYYTSDAKLAPEMGNSIANGTLGSIASSFGFDLSEMQTSDAITPLLYPDLMEDNGFVAGLFNIKVISQDGEVNTTYYDYLKKHQKTSIWSYPFRWIKSLLPKSEDKGGTKGQFDPYYLSKSDDDLASVIRNNIQFSIDKKTGVISISTKAQDALICKTLADSISVHLQDFITEYRTNKARVDYEYYRQLTKKAKDDYEKVRRQYANMADANSNIALRSVELKLQDLENDMQLKFNAYTTISNQLEAAKAKVQERTPAFTILKGAAVPIQPTGPKRMIFVLGMLFLVTFGVSFWIIRGILFGEGA